MGRWTRATQQKETAVAPASMDPRLVSVSKNHAHQIDGLLALAREILGMEAAYVSEFIDGKQTYRALEGDSDSFGHSLGDGPALAGTYCNAMVNGDLPNLISDARLDGLTASLPITQEAGIGSYVGVPVRLSDGRVYGTMCCLSHDANPDLREQDIGFMHFLARLAADNIEREELQQRIVELKNEQNRGLERKVEERTAELRRAVQDLESVRDELQDSREETVYRLSIAAEYRDDETSRHIQRMSRYCGILMRAAGFDEERTELVQLASQMHDIGKIGMPDAILLKPGSLSLDERREMERHPEIGYGILSGSDSELLQLAATIAMTHHERMDGTGYPRGLSGADIPLEGRVAAIADVFDALTSDRVYREAFPMDVAIQMLREAGGTHLDPVLLEIFLSALPEVIGLSGWVRAS